MTRTVTLRLSTAQADELGLVARVLDMPMVAVVRAAVEEYLKYQAADPDFQERVQRAIEENRRARDRLTSPQ